MLETHAHADHLSFTSLAGLKQGVPIYAPPAVAKWLARLGYQFAHLPEVLAAFRWHETNTSAVQLERRRAERLRVQQEQLRLSGRPALLQHPRVLAALYRVYQLKRGWLRLAR